MHGKHQLVFLSNGKPKKRPCSPEGVCFPQIMVAVFYQIIWTRSCSPQSGICL